VGNPHKNLNFFGRKEGKPFKHIKCDQNQPKPISQNQTQVFVHQDWGEIVGNPHKNLNLLEEKKEKPSNV
jgi:hypothetical protein